MVLGFYIVEKDNKGVKFRVVSSLPLNKMIVSLLEPIKTQPSQTQPKLKKINNIRAVLFDVYGTLLTTNVGANSLSEPSVEFDQAIISALEASDFDIFDKKVPFSRLYVEHVRAHYDIRHAEGITYPEINICDVWQDFLNELFASGTIDGDLTERAIRRLIIRHECMVNPVWPQSGALECLRKLQDRNIAIGTISTAQFYTPITMEALFQNSLETLGFKRPICIWSYEHRHRKPSAIMFQLCVEGLKALGISPEEAIYVGNDMVNDIIPANKVGLKTALFAGDDSSLRLHEDNEEASKTKPTIIFNSFSQLLDSLV